MIAAVQVRSLCAVLVAAVFLVAGGPARSQPQPSANATALAKELVNILGATRQFDGIPGQLESASTRVILQSANLIIQANQSLYKDVEEIVNSLVEEYRPRSTELSNEVIRLYATRFTEAELKDLVNFYKSPVGKKLLSESQLILDESAKRADAWASKFREEVVAKLKAELKKRGHNL